MHHEPFLSTSWYRVAGLKPKLPEHAQVLRHSYRGMVWHVLQDPASGRSHRLSPASYTVVAGMDGTRTVDELVSDLNAALEAQGHSAHGNVPREAVEQNLGLLAKLGLLVA